MSTNIVVVAFICCVVGCAHAQAVKYAVGLLPSIPDEYVVASLSDLNSVAFATQYNSAGLNFVQAFPSAPTCCIASVQEGFLSFGYSDSNSNFLEPFVDGAGACGPSTQPTGATLGVPSSSAGPYEGMWISLLTPKEQGALRVTGLVPNNATIVNCNGAPSIVLLKYVPKYVIRPQGANYPAPNATEYEVASLNDLHATDFMTYYNSQYGILLTGTNENIGYCCLIRVADGWLNFGAPPTASVIELYYDDSTSWTCNGGTNNILANIGTQYNQGFSQLTATDVAQLGSFTNITQWCSATTDTLTLYKRVASPKYIVGLYGADVPPPPQYTIATLADAQSVDFQVAYNAAGGVNLSAFESTDSICCIVQVAEGSLNYNPSAGLSPLVLFSPNSPTQEICSDEVFSELTLLGSVGVDALVFYTLNVSTTSSFSTFSLSNSTYCGGVSASLTLFKRLF
jgi:hypothetical protein